MEPRRSRSVVLILVKLPVAIHERQLLKNPKVSVLFAEADIFSRDLEKMFFQDKSQGHCVKLGEGAFLADEDAWYPHILSLMKWCDEKKFPYTIVPVGESATTFSGEHQDAVSWLAEKGKRTRVSHLLPARPGS